MPVLGSTISLALVVTRVARKESAAALPRPSAMLSATLANRTVAHSHSASWMAKPAAWPLAAATTAEAVASRATIQVAKITGFLRSLVGFSLTTASPRARPSMAPVSPPATGEDRGLDGSSVT
ncbi:hypothetical protein D3C80_1400100 [compost metagenome]